MRLNVIAPVRDEGTVVVFRGEDDHGSRALFAADHRPARDIVKALERGEDVEVDVEPWQLVAIEG